MTVYCPYCNRPSVFKQSSKGIFKKDYGPVYHCEPCGAYVGCHPGSDRPRGTLANKELREWRKAVHKNFDLIWRNEYLSRSEAYKFLSNIMNIPFESCHIGMFGVEECKRAIKLVRECFLYGKQLTFITGDNIL